MGATAGDWRIQQSEKQLQAEVFRHSCYAIKPETLLKAENLIMMVLDRTSYYEALLKDQ
jgi:hypothetical protein